MDRLEELYSDYINREEYSLGDSQTTEVISARENYNKLLSEIVLGENSAILDDAVCDVAYTHEQQGFIHGFKYAMQLAAEIFQQGSLA